MFPSSRPSGGLLQSLLREFAEASAQRRPSPYPRSLPFSSTSHASAPPPRLRFPSSFSSSTSSLHSPLSTPFLRSPFTRHYTSSTDLAQLRDAIDSARGTPEEPLAKLRLVAALARQSDLESKEELVALYEDATAFWEDKPEHKWGAVEAARDEAAFKAYLQALASVASQAGDDVAPRLFEKLQTAKGRREEILKLASSSSAAAPAPAPSPTPSFSPVALITGLFGGLGARGKGGQAKVQSVGSYGSWSSASAAGAAAKNSGEAAEPEPIRVIVEEAKSPLGWRVLKFVATTALYSFLLLSLLSLLIDSSGILRAGGQSTSFQPTAAPDPNDPSRRGTTFKDVHGVEEAKDELYEIVEFLKDPKKFEKLGGRLPRGILLTGPPGTGKTLLARAVAGEAGVPFFSASGSEFDEMYVGVGARRIRELFAAARKNSPAIIFIDELDAIGGKRSSKDQTFHKQTLNQLLTEMDGFATGEGLILIGATNFPELLDKALVRPGRFDRHVVVPLPDVRGRMEIVRHHLKNIVYDKSAVDLSIIARGTIGFSGADLQALVNQAAVKASAENADTVKAAHFEWAKERIMMGAARLSAFITPENKLATAYHEAGHALLAIYTKGAYPLQSITVIPRGNALGYTLMLPEEEKQPPSEESTRVSSVMPPASSTHATDKQPGIAVAFTAEHRAKAFDFNIRKGTLDAETGLIAFPKPVLGHFATDEKGAIGVDEKSADADMDGDDEATGNASRIPRSHQRSHLYDDVDIHALKNELQGVEDEQSRCAIFLKHFKRDVLLETRKQIDQLPAGTEVFQLTAQCKRRGELQEGKEGASFVVFESITDEMMRDKVVTIKDDVLDEHVGSSAECDIPSPGDIVASRLRFEEYLRMYNARGLVLIGAHAIGRAASSVLGIDFHSGARDAESILPPAVPTSCSVHTGNLGYHLPSSQSGPLLACMLGSLKATHLPDSKLQSFWVKTDFELSDRAPTYHSAGSYKSAIEAFDLDPHDLETKSTRFFVEQQPTVATRLLGHEWTVEDRQKVQNNSLDRYYERTQIIASWICRNGHENAITHQTADGELVASSCTASNDCFVNAMMQDLPKPGETPYQFVTTRTLKQRKIDAKPGASAKKVARNKKLTGPGSSPAQRAYDTSEEGRAYNRYSCGLRLSRTNPQKPLGKAAWREQIYLPAGGVLYEGPGKGWRGKSHSFIEYRAKLDVAMGGRVAEEIIFGKDNISDGASSDIANATSVAANMVRRFGFSDAIGPVAHTGGDDSPPPSQETQRTIDSEVKGLIEAAQERARQTLRAKSVELERLARALVEYETLDSAEVQKVIQGQKLDRSGV
ncbi:hypothetical protein JCM10207_004088 [Rhodosporidiobolus poonsookiae]